MIDEALPSAPQARARGKVTIYFVVFDVLAYGADDLRAVPYQRRRARLEQLFVAAAPPLQLAPSTTDRVAAMAWIPPEVSAVGIEGMVASSSTRRIARAVPAHG
ncbi:hypothetical protein [Amycolatopsis sp. NPDC051372]|uniref:ATP-dependent DNA ligase n=1 Tax=Amycolatopsis sp. NPDC051372 TaxID=3155669 RepID=UPI00342B42C5